jgi:ferredoxin
VKVTADTLKCVAAGNCVAVAPDVFEQDDDNGIVRVLNEEPGEDRRDAVREAVEFCPAQALKLNAEA